MLLTFEGRFVLRFYVQVSLAAAYGCISFPQVEYQKNLHKPGR